MDKENERIRLKEIIAFEKSQMLPFDFTISYILTPIYVVICILLGGIFAILMEIDDEKYLVQGLLCLGAFVLISVLFLICVPFFRKKTIKLELERYDFDTTKEESLEIWVFSTEEFSLKFDRNGMYINDELFYYNHLSKTVVTSNYCKRIWIYLQFALSEEEAVTLPVAPDTLKMLECLEIKLDNEHILNYIISNKQEAFEQIYNRGYINYSL
ncbi:MAG: hypothetical protein J6L81_04715 [Clostridia bacterium]|nr:hypothetical protein [Clostridia bacterium]